MHRFLLCLVLVCSSFVSAKETEVQLANDVAGKLNVPDVGTDGKRAVLMLHGWNSNMDEVGGLYQQLALNLEKQGIASLRISFTGEGAQSNYIVTSTFDSRVAQAKAAFEFLRESYPDASYGVVGFSLGGLTAMGLLKDYPDAFSTMVLWSAAERMGINGDPNYDAAAMRAMREGSAVYKDFVDFTLTREHLSSFVGVDVHHNLAAFHGSLLSIRGDKDFLPSPERRWFDVSPSTDKSFLMIGGANHIFNVLDEPAKSYPARLLEATSRWFARTL